MLLVNLFFQFKTVFHIYTPEVCSTSGVHFITAPYLIYFHGRVPGPVFEDSEHLDIKEAGHDREQAQCEEDDY